MLIDVVEHVCDYYGLLRNVGRVAEYVVAHIPLEMNVSSVLRQRSLTNARTQLGHIHHFNRDTALATFRDCHYEIIGHRITAGAAELPTTSIKKKLAKYPRKLVGMFSLDLAAHLLGGHSILVLAKSPPAAVA